MRSNNTSIINFSYERLNYGAVLTAYAISKILEVNFNLKPLLPDNISPFFRVTGWKYRFLLPFKRKYLNMSKPKTKREHFWELNEICDTFLVGSDQVFRPIYAKNCLYQFFLNFVEPDKKKISISASFGVTKEKLLEESDNITLSKIKESLRSFDFISVREKSGVEICKDIFDVDAEWIIDPVFILDKSYYEKIAATSLKDFNNKIISYIINQKDNTKVVEMYREKNNIEIVELYKSKMPMEDWLNAIKNCKLLITDSFHAACFAIIFNKPFICTVNPHTGIARYESIFEMLQIKNQLITSEISELSDNYIFKIDYDNVNKLIEKERQKGLEFLKNAFDAEPTKLKEKQEVYEKFIIEMKSKKRIYNNLKEFFWICWLFIFHNILPNPIKNVIRFVKRRINGQNK